MAEAGRSVGRPRPSLLLISFSDINSDARVLKQVRLFRDRFDVTTCGFGTAPDGVVAHLRVPDGLRTTDLNGRLITARLYRAAYWRTSAIRWSRERLERSKYDIIFANEADAVPLALWLRPHAGVHADLHEFHPRVKEHLPLWNRRIRPYVEWICRRYIKRADSTTTVGEGIAQEYERQFAFRPKVVMNATEFADRHPTSTHEPLRFVHSGSSARARGLSTTVEAFARCQSRATLDLYLTRTDPEHISELRRIADQADGRVRVLDPVPYDRLVETIGAYDVGIFVVPPVTFNLRWTLPNKFFDFVQARLAQLVGPSPEMARLVEQYGFGVITDGFSVDDIVRAVDGLDPVRVDAMKSRAHSHARELAEHSAGIPWLEAVDALLVSRRRAVQ